MMMTEGNYRRLIFALPEDGLPFDKLDLLARRMLRPEQRDAGMWGPWWKSTIRRALRELVAAKRVCFRDGKYYRAPGQRIALPRKLRLPGEAFEHLWPEVAAGAWSVRDEDDRGEFHLPYPHAKDRLARLSFRTLTAHLFPPGQRGPIILLRAYIDDSGTHDDSDVVTMGAFLASDEDWQALEFDWCRRLDREPVGAFHMSKCEAGADPFFWEWGRRASLIHDLRQLIIKYRLFGTSLSIARRDWDDLVVGEHRTYLGSAIDMAFGGVIGVLSAHARQLHPGQKIALIVDDQETRRKDLKQILDNYETLREQYPEFVSATFGSMRDFVPLQAADMLAWESYKYAEEWFKTDGKPIARAHFQDFLNHALVRGTLMGRAEIQKQINGGYVRLE